MSFEYYFFARPSLLGGVARVIDLPGTLSREAVITSPNPREADRRALESDWRVVGADVADAMHTLEGNGATR